MMVMSWFAYTIKLQCPATLSVTLFQSKAKFINVNELKSWHITYTKGRGAVEETPYSKLYIIPFCLIGLSGRPL